MSTFMAYLYVILFFIFLGFLYLIVLLFFDNSSSNQEASNKNNATIRSNSPNKIKCRCMKCGQVIMVPKQYLKDLSYHDPQSSKCPKCGMTKVEIIQTWGLH